MFGRVLNMYYVEGARIWSFSGPYFSAFGLDKERYSVSLRIQSDCGKIQTRKYGHFSRSDASVIDAFSNLWKFQGHNSCTLFLFGAATRGGLFASLYPLSHPIFSETKNN